MIDDERRDDEPVDSQFEEFTQNIAKRLRLGQCRQMLISDLPSLIEQLGLIGEWNAVKAEPFEYRFLTPDELASSGPSLKEASKQLAGNTGSFGAAQFYAMLADELPDERRDIGKLYVQVRATVHDETILTEYVEEARKAVAQLASIHSVLQEGVYSENGSELTMSYLEIAESLMSAVISLTDLNAIATVTELSYKGRSFDTALDAVSAYLDLLFKLRID